MRSIALIVILLFHSNLFATEFEKLGICELPAMSGANRILIEIYIQKQEARLVVNATVQDEEYNFVVDGSIQYDCDGYPLVSAPEIGFFQVNMIDEDPTFSVVSIGGHSLPVRCRVDRGQ